MYYVISQVDCDIKLSQQIKHHSSLNFSDLILGTCVKQDLMLKQYTMQHN